MPSSCPSPCYRGCLRCAFSSSSFPVRAESRSSTCIYVVLLDVCLGVVCPRHFSPARLIMVVLDRNPKAYKIVKSKIYPNHRCSLALGDVLWSQSKCITRKERGLGNAKMVINQEHPEQTTRSSMFHAPYTLKHTIIIATSESFSSQKKLCPFLVHELDHPSHSTNSLNDIILISTQAKQSGEHLGDS